jgi:hypothetical protein
VVVGDGIRVRISDCIGDDACLSDGDIIRHELRAVVGNGVGRGFSKGLDIPVRDGNRDVGSDDISERISDDIDSRASDCGKDRFSKERGGNIGDGGSIVIGDSYKASIQGFRGVASDGGGDGLLDYGGSALFSPGARGGAPVAVAYSFGGPDGGRPTLDGLGGRSHLGRDIE